MVLICICFGPAGCGKSTVATALSQSFNCAFIEGDTLHSLENVEKMKNGIALNDDDRSQWLQSVREKFLKQYEAIKASCGNKLILVTCSALKLAYRKVLRDVDIGTTDIKIIFIYLRVSPNCLSQRLLTRKGHFMSASMLSSQLQILEEPKPDEPNVWIIDANEPLETIVSILSDKINNELSH